MAVPRLTYADLPPEIWGQEVCRTLDDYAISALICAGGEFRTLLAGITPPAKKCHYCCGDPSNATLRNSVAAGHIACVTAQLPDDLEFEWPMGLTRRAAKHGRTEVLRQLRSRSCPWSGGETQWAAHCGHIETLRLLHLELGHGWSGDETSWAAAGGQTETLRVLLKLGCPWSGEETYMAAGYGRTETLRVLRQELSCEWSGEETSWAAAGGHIETLRVLRRELGCSWSGGETSQAACHGHIETIRVLREELNCPE